MIKCDGKMGCGTIVSMKLTTVVFTIIVLKLWTGAATWVNNTNIWWFVGAFVVFAIFAGASHGCCGPVSGKETVKKKVAKKKK
jgi:hypothetical protein